MRVCIEIRHGPNHDYYVSKAEIQKNIDALERAADKANAPDSMLIMDTISILQGIQRELHS